MTELSGCGDIRLALGVYVVGAIDPAERSIVDAHLSHCAACREELAGLAGLPPCSAGSRPATSNGSPIPSMPSAWRSRRPNCSAHCSGGSRRGAGHASGAPSPPRRRPRSSRWVAAWPAVPRSRASSARGWWPPPRINRPSTSKTRPPTRGPTSRRWSLFLQGLGNLDAGLGVGRPSGHDLRVLGGERPGAAVGGRRLDRAARLSEPWYMASTPVSSAKIQGFQVTADGRVLVTVPADEPHSRCAGGNAAAARGA